VLLTGSELRIGAHKLEGPFDQWPSLFDKVEAFALPKAATSAGYGLTTTPEVKMDRFRELWHKRTCANEVSNSAGWSYEPAGDQRPGRPFRLCSAGASFVPSPS